MSDGEKPQSPKNKFQEQLRALKESRFDPKRKVDIPVSILELKNLAICTAGNISNIQGQAKSAKSSVMGAAIAAVLRNLLGKPPCPEETLGFGSKLPPNNDKQAKCILHFDTEQSPYHHHKLCMDVMARAGVTREEYNTIPYHSYSLVTTDHSLRRKMLEQLVVEFTQNGQSLACLFLDGVADIISDPNNAEESFDVVDWLHGLSAKQKCAVITVLHENPSPNNNKARGHLGSQITRKSETNLSVSKGGSGKKGQEKDQDDPVSTIWVERARGGHIAEKDGVKISWCESKKRHTIHDPSRGKKKAEVKEAPAAEPKSSELTSTQQRTKAWLEKTALKEPKKRKQLLELITNRLRCSSSTAHNHIKAWVQLGWLHKRPGAGSAPYVLGPAPADETIPENSEIAQLPVPTSTPEPSATNPKSRNPRNAETKAAAKKVKGSGAKPKPGDDSKNPKKAIPAKVTKPKATRTKEKDATRP